MLHFQVFTSANPPFVRRSFPFLPSPSPPLETLPFSIPFSLPLLSVLSLIFPLSTLPCLLASFLSFSLPVSPCPSSPPLSHLPSVFLCSFSDTTTRFARDRPSSSILSRRRARRPSQARIYEYTMNALPSLLSSRSSSNPRISSSCAVSALLQTQRPSHRGILSVSPTWTHTGRKRQRKRER